jgi:sugar-specific transcriptional regulator TrmB
MTSLRRLGLTQYEEKIYLTLLKEGSLTGGKVSKLSKVPHGRTYEVLLNLVDKGFVSVIPIKPKIFKAIKPEICVPHFANKKRGEFLDIEKKALGELKDIEKRIGVPSKEEDIIIMKGKRDVLALIDYNIKMSKKYIKAMFTYELVSYNTSRLTWEAVKRGVKVKHIATKITKKGLKMMKEDIKRGVKVRYFPVKEMRLNLIDGEEIVQSIVNPENLMDRVSILIKNKELAKSLEHYFDSIWRKAKKIENIKI